MPSVHYPSISCRTSSSVGEGRWRRRVVIYCGSAPDGGYWFLSRLIGRSHTPYAALTRTATFQTCCGCGAAPRSVGFPPTTLIGERSRRPMVECTAPARRAMHAPPSARASLQSSRLAEIWIGHGKRRGLPYPRPLDLRHPPLSWQRCPKIRTRRVTPRFCRISGHLAPLRRRANAAGSPRLFRGQRRRSGLVLRQH